MNLDCNFRFQDAELNDKLIKLLRDRRIPFRVDEKGLIHYSKSDTDIVENVLINSLRDSLFSSWQVLSCPEDWATRYMTYMKRHGVRYCIELSDGEVSFLIPGSLNPHRWKNL